MATGALLATARRVVSTRRHRAGRRSTATVTEPAADDAATTAGDGQQAARRSGSRRGPLSAEKVAKAAAKCPAPQPPRSPRRPAFQPVHRPPPPARYASPTRQQPPRWLRKHPPSPPPNTTRGDAMDEAHRPDELTALRTDLGALADLGRRPAQHRLLRPPIDRRAHDAPSSTPCWRTRRHRFALSDTRRHGTKPPSSAVPPVSTRTPFTMPRREPDGPAQPHP